MNIIKMPTQKRPFKSFLWDLATLVVLIAILALGLLFLNIYLNPASNLNPFPPPPAPVLLQFPTATNTVPPQEPTTTFTPTVTPTLTRTPRPTFTFAPTFTPYYLTTPRNTATPREAPTKTLPATQTNTIEITSIVVSPTSGTPTDSGMPFAATVDYLASTVYHPDSACNWMGMAGQVVDKNNGPILYLTIHLGGEVGGQMMDYLGLSGTASTFGPSGFEFVFGDKPVASTQTLWIQLLDQQQLPFSEKIYLDTFDDCARNLIIVRFKKVQ